MPGTDWAVKNIGPCKLDYDGVDLGQTHGDVKLMLKQDVAIGTSDATGNTARQKVISGEAYKVQAAITEITSVILEKIMAGVTANDLAVNNSASVSSAVGTDLVESAKLLIIKPLVGQTVSSSKDWIYIPKASVTVDANVAFSPTNQKDWNVEFEAHPVLAADLASGGNLNAVTPAFVVGNLIRFGTELAA